MYWWEFDLSYLLLRGLEKLGLVWDLKVYPEAIYAEAEQRSAEGGPVE
jgi:stearoyl-CoA desaturase (delta-9 desaturase)